MWRTTLLGLCAITVMMFATAGGQAAQKKNLGPTVAIPKGGSVQMQNNGHFTIKAPGGLGVGGSYECFCAGGKGSCTVVNDGTSLWCTKGTAGTCAGKCEMGTTTTGIQ